MAPACWSVAVRRLGKGLDFGCWTDALNWRGTAGLLLQGPGELTHAWASVSTCLTDLTQG
eukprot:522023-Pelagomonas_calceolata.AAC.1